jgi:hypothetical protein
VYAESVYIIYCIRPSLNLFVSETNRDRTRANPNFSVVGRRTLKKKKNLKTWLLHAGKPHSSLEFVVAMLLGYVRNCLGENFAQACL